MKNPSLDPQFRVYYSKEWLDALITSFRNFLSEIFNGTHILPELNLYETILCLFDLY
jgi:WD repeat-containing protein 91